MKVDHYESGSLYGIRYELETGEGFPMHSHVGSLAHNVIVLKGRVAFESQGVVRVLQAEAYDFDGSIPHRITALEPSVILNLFLHGKPYEFSPEEKHMIL